MFVHNTSANKVGVVALRAAGERLSGVHFTTAPRGSDMPQSATGPSYVSMSC